MFPLLFTACGSKNSDELTNECVEDAEDSEEDIEEEGGAAEESDFSWMREEETFSEEDCESSNAVYVKSDDTFITCSPTNPGQHYKAYITDISDDHLGSAFIPTLDRSTDELVVFSESGFDYAEVTKVKDCGYTIPLFEEYIVGSVRSRDEPIMSYSLTRHAVLFSPEYFLAAVPFEDADEYSDVEESASVGLMLGSALETLNDEKPMDLYDRGDVVECKGTDTVDGDRSDIIFPFEQGESVTVGYRHGTAYEEFPFVAEARAFKALEDAQQLDVEYEKTSYVTVDISDLEPGTYLVDFSSNTYGQLYYAVNIK